jgi:diadenosine tetraphosphate (Ap4A) HIT family hydrolase
MSCPLCDEDGGLVVHREKGLRVVRVLDDANFPAFYRVVWDAHVTEFSDLAAADRHRLIDRVAAVEAALRQALQPTKVNVASLGNMVAHQHWHVIARFDWDSHYPGPIWATPQRTVQPPPAGRLALSLTALDERVRQALIASA